MLMPLNVPVRITFKDGKRIECVVIDEICVIGDIYYRTSHTIHNTIATECIQDVEKLENENADKETTAKTCAETSESDG